MPKKLKKLGLDEDFTGVEEADGEFTLTETVETDNGERRPFKAFLDVGLPRTSTGARVFGAMKGASDGGIFIPHSEKRFPGYDMETKELDSDTLRNYIYGGHVAEYMETLADDDEERYKSQFQKYIDDDIEADGVEDLYTEAHAAIREDISANMGALETLQARFACQLLFVESGGDNLAANYSRELADYIVYVIDVAVRAHACAPLLVVVWC